MVRLLLTVSFWLHEKQDTRIHPNVGVAQNHVADQTVLRLAVPLTLRTRRPVYQPRYEVGAALGCIEELSIAEKR